MTVHENLLKAFSEAANDGVGVFSEARAAVVEFVTDLVSFSQVLLTFKDSGSKEFVSFVGEYPDLYQQYAAAYGLVEPLYDCCYFDFSGPCFVVTVDGVNSLLLLFGAGISAVVALNDTRSPNSETVDSEDSWFSVDDFEGEVCKEQTKLLPEFQPVALAEKVLDGLEDCNWCSLNVVLESPLSEPDDWTTELL